jgi:hypothetical protein
MSDDDRDEDYILPEDHLTFAGPCTCDHERDEHGWGCCDVEDCPCDAGWEE